MEKTLYITDLDGTLLRGDATLGKKTIQVVNRLIERGGMFTYATARSYMSAKQVTERLMLTLPAVAYDGAFIVDPADGRRIESHLIDPAAVSDLSRLFQRLDISPLVYGIIDGEERVSWLSGQNNPGVTNYLNVRRGDKRMREADGRDALFAGDVFYISVIGTRAEMEAVARHLTHPETQWYLQEDTYTPGEYWIGMYHAKASKASGALRVKELCGADRIVCFGDNLNDLPMFRVADECYAVQNARDSLKAIATGVIGHNDQEGLAEWLMGREGIVIDEPAPR